MPEGRRARAVLAAGVTGLTAAVVAGVLLAPAAACTTHACDPSYATFPAPGDGTSGSILTVFAGGQAVWQSSPLEGPWLDYPGNRTITVTYPQGFTNATGFNVVVATAPYQDGGGSTATTAAGQLDQLFNLNDAGFQLQNGSCGDYNVYFSVNGRWAAPPGDADAGPDSGAAEPLDAGADASRE